MNKKLLFVINVDWYFCLHWLARAQAAKQAGYDVHIATQQTNTVHIQQLQLLGFKVHTIGLSRKSMGLGDNIHTFRELYTLIKRLQPELIHSITVKPNLFVGLICKYLKIPQIMSVTGLGLTFSSNTTKARISRFIVTSLYRFSSKNRHHHQILFENADDKTLFEQEGIALASQMRVIAGAGVDLDEYKYSLLPTRLDAAPHTVLFAARMLWDKGLPVLIEAIDNLQKQGYSVRLAVAGIIDNDSQNAIPLATIEQWHALGKIDWLGQVSDMVDAIKQSNIVCLPTQYGEGVPRILIEAAAIGRPIIATNVAGCRDIVSDNKTGFLVPLKQSDILANRLKVLLDSPEMCQEFGLAARRKVEQTFCQKIVIEKTLETYKQVLT